VRLSWTVEIADSMEATEDVMAVFVLLAVVVIVFSIAVVDDEIAVRVASPSDTMAARVAAPSVAMACVKFSRVAAAADSIVVLVSSASDSTNPWMVIEVLHGE